MAELFKTRIYVPGREKPDLTPYYIILTLCGAILYLLWPDDTYFLWFLFPAMALIYFQQYYYDSGRQKLYGYLGRYLVLEHAGVRASGVLYPYEEIEQFEIDVFDYDGERRVSNHAVSIERGVNNRISFTIQGQNHTYPFHIRSQKHQQELRAVLDALLISGIKVKVYFKGRVSTVF